MRIKIYKVHMKEIEIVLQFKPANIFFWFIGNFLLFNCYSSKKGYKGWRKRVENVNNNCKRYFPTQFASSQGLRRRFSCVIRIGKIWNGRREKVKWEIEIFLCVRWYFKTEENSAVKTKIFIPRLHKDLALAEKFSCD